VRFSPDLSSRPGVAVHLAPTYTRAVLQPLVLFAIIYGGSACGHAVRATTNSHLSACTQYSDTPLSPSARLVLYAEHQPEVEGTDTEHHVYVSLLHRRPRSDQWEIVDREEITDHLLNNGDRGFLERLAVLVNDFTIDGQGVLDVSVLAGISGNGGISRIDDLFYIVRDADLMNVGMFQGTAAWWKSGAHERSETHSTLQVVGPYLLWDRSERRARGTVETAKIDCHEDRRVYRWRNGALMPGNVTEAELAGKRSTTLRRFDLHTTVDCTRAR
jgi:hypothetical protein